MLLLATHDTGILDALASVTTLGASAVQREATNCSSTVIHGRVLHHAFAIIHLVNHSTNTVKARGSGVIKQLSQLSQYIRERAGGEKSQMLQKRLKTSKPCS